MSWDERFIQLARQIATWSKDPSTKVGAVIVDDQKRIIGLGYNGFARGVEDTPERYEDRSVKYPLVVHAELNAILNAVKSVEGATLYCTHFPCARCASNIIQSGIKKVRTVRPDDDYYSRWEKEIDLTIDIFLEAGVEAQYVD